MVNKVARPWNWMTRVCARRFCRIRNRKCINGLENVVLMESAIPFQPAAGTRNLWRTYRGSPFVPKHFHWNGPFPLALSFQSVEAENVAKLRAACERNFQIRFLPSAAESSWTTRHKEFLSIFFDSQEKNHTDSGIWDIWDRWLSNIKLSLVTTFETSFAPHSATHINNFFTCLLICS